MTTDSERQAAFLQAHEELILNYAFLFEHNHPFIPLPEYLQHFSRQSPLTYFSCPWQYQLGLLERYKRDVVWTSTIVDGEGHRSLVILLQPSPTLHLVVYPNYSVEHDQLIISVELWTAEAKDIPVVVKAHKALRVHSDKKAGFRH